MASSVASSLSAVSVSAYDPKCLAKAFSSTGTQKMSSDGHRANAGLPSAPHGSLSSTKKTRQPAAVSSPSPGTKSRTA
eukprot:5069969-Pleurochrysis_carterae.AAC.2